jgi:hypothetical protein
MTELPDGCLWESRMYRKPSVYDVVLMRGMLPRVHHLTCVSGRVMHSIFYGHTIYLQLSIRSRRLSEGRVGMNYRKRFSCTCMILMSIGLCCI